jgi:hypothetical protein
MKSAYKILASLKGRDYSDDNKCRWKDNIKIDLGRLEQNVVDWIHLVQDMVSVGSTA